MWWLWRPQRNLILEPTTMRKAALAAVLASIAIGTAGYWAWHVWQSWERGYVTDGKPADKPFDHLDSNPF
jgi:hypothetical protein